MNRETAEAIQFSVASIMAGLVLIMAIVGGTKCEKARIDANRGAFLECIKTTQKPLECRARIAQ